MKTRIDEKKINIIVRDALVLTGSAAVIAGCSLAWLPLGLIVGGLALGFLGIAGQMEVERRHAEDARKRRLGS